MRKNYKQAEKISEDYGKDTFLYDLECKRDYLIEYIFAMYEGNIEITDISSDKMLSEFEKVGLQYIRSALNLDRGKQKVTRPAKQIKTTHVSDLSPDEG